MAETGRMTRSGDTVAALRLDLGRTWSDAGAMMRANIDSVSAIAGMFMLLPGIVFSWFVADPQPSKDGAALTDFTHYMEVNWHYIAANGLVSAFGSLALLALLLHPARPTVANAMRAGLLLLPFYILANFCQWMIVMGGLFLFILPGLYLAARFICIAPVVAVEGPRGPFSILVRSFHLTRGNGWRIALMMAVILFVALITIQVVSLIAGIVGIILLPPELARLFGIVVTSVVQTALAVAVTLVSASIYRQASAPPRPVII